MIPLLSHLQKIHIYVLSKLGMCTSLTIVDANVDIAQNVLIDPIKIGACMIVNQSSEIVWLCNISILTFA